MADPHWQDRWSLDPSIVFLNHGSFGACPRVVLEKQAELRARLEREPVDFFTRFFPPRLEAARARVAEFVNADPANLVFVPNATAAVNAVLRSLTFESHDEILILDHGYPAVRKAAAFVAERAGARVVTARLPYPISSAPSSGHETASSTAAADIVAAVLDVVTERTRLAIIDHVTSPTGLVLPIDRLVDEIQGRGVDVVVDGAHGPGMCALDLRRMKPAYYAGNGHKWLCAPKSVGFLVVRADRQAGLHPPVISHGFGREDVANALHAEFDWTGTFDPTPALCLPTAIDTLGTWTNGWPTLRADLNQRAGEGQRVILTRLGLTAPAPADMAGHMAVIALPAQEEMQRGAQDPLHNRLFERHMIEVPVIQWSEPDLRLIRISAHLYNGRRDYERLSEALATELDAA